MEGYVSIHRIVDRQIFVNVPKFRIYTRLHDFTSEGFFQNGQAASDATFALVASLSPPHIDYILDMRSCGPWPRDIFQLWKEKTLEMMSRYPQLYAVGVAKADSPLWLQISGWKGLFKKYSNRILRTVETSEEADALFDKLRNVESSLSSLCSENHSLSLDSCSQLQIGLRRKPELPSLSRETILEFIRLKPKKPFS